MRGRSEGGMNQKSRAVVLRVTDFGEADRLVTFFTEDFGKLKGVAKHAKKSKKRFGGGLECGSIGVVRYFERQNAELVRLDEFAVEQPSWKITGSLEKIVTLHISIEMADKMLPLAHASRERFGLLSRWIVFLSENDLCPRHRHAFYYKWLAASGLEPVFDKCVVCGNAFPYWIESSYGGAVCKNCHSANKNAIMVLPQTLKYLQGFKLGKISDGANKDADKVFEYLLLHAIGGELKSLEIARKLE